MKRILALAGLALAGALTACGPDCDRFCKHLDDCFVAKNQQFDEPQCVQSCNDVGGDHPAYISCVINTSCLDIDNGHCVIPTTKP